jgi:hypothetical protein
VPHFWLRVEKIGVPLQTCVCYTKAGGNADGNVDFALRHHEVGDLVVSAAVQSLLLQVPAGENMVFVAVIKQEVSNGDVFREETLVAKPHLK